MVFAMYLHHPGSWGGIRYKLCVGFRPLQFFWFPKIGFRPSNVYWAGLNLWQRDCVPLKWQNIMHLYGTGCRPKRWPGQRRNCEDNLTRILWIRKLPNRPGKTTPDSFGCGTLKKHLARHDFSHQEDLLTEFAVFHIHCWKGAHEFSTLSMAQMSVTLPVERVVVFAAEIFVEVSCAGEIVQ